MEHRLESRFERVPGYGLASAVSATMNAAHVQATATRHEAAQLREVQERQERVRAEHLATDLQ